jgi:hypothetical protein
MYQQARAASGQTRQDPRGGQSTGGRNAGGQSTGGRNAGGRNAGGRSAGGRSAGGGFRRGKPNLDAIEEAEFEDITDNKTESKSGPTA